MANRRKLAYTAGFIVLCWVAIAALIGIFVGLAHLLNNTTATIVLFHVVIYSGLFGFLATQLYKLNGKRDGWPSVKRSDRQWGGADSKRVNESEDAEDMGSGWK